MHGGGNCRGSMQTAKLEPACIRICVPAPPLLFSAEVKLTRAIPVLTLLFALHGAFLPAGLAATPASRGPEGKKTAKTPPGSEIFGKPTVLDFQVLLVETNLQSLRDRPRDYTRAIVVVNGITNREVGVKLKGAAGSFRPVDDRPALTLNFDKWIQNQRVFGLRRLHLNNSVQDESRMNEYIASELFRSAGVPTPRVAWATVRINDRQLGLYVLKEAYETEFLKIYFGSAKGNLYEGGFVKDIGRDMVKESGDGPDDCSDVLALQAATLEKDSTNRWTKLQKLMDVELFANYAALSVMLADWDGYALNRNNYRLYFRPGDGRAVMIPHGMDQLFQRSDMEMDSYWNGSLAWSLFDTPQGRKLYEERCQQVFTNVFKLDHITNMIAQATVVLKEADPLVARYAKDLTDRIERRHRNLRRDPMLKPPTPATTNTVPAK